MQVKGRSNQIWINLTALLLQFPLFSRDLQPLHSFQGFSIAQSSSRHPGQFVLQQLRAKEFHLRGTEAGKGQEGILQGRDCNQAEKCAFDRTYAVTGAVAVLQPLPLSTISPCSLPTQVLAAELHRSLHGR